MAFSHEWSRHEFPRTSTSTAAGMEWDVVSFFFRVIDVSYGVSLVLRDGVFIDFRFFFA